MFSEVLFADFETCEKIKSSNKKLGNYDTDNLYPKEREEYKNKFLVIPATRKTWQFR